MIEELSKELAKAGIDQEQLELIQLLEQRRITRTKEIPPIQFLFNLFGIPCFPRGELVAVTGKHKSGKTILCSIVMSLGTLRQNLQFTRVETDPLHVLWIDTEQSDTSTQDILRERIAGMVGKEEFPDDMYDIFNLRIDNWQCRMPLVKCAIETIHPDLVIFDGVRDVVGDINDYESAQNTVEALLRLVSATNCCMVCVLHENKSLEDKTLRGAIGTELQNKCFEQYAMEKSDQHVFTFTQTHTRKFDIDRKLQFTVNNDGLPELYTCEFEGTVKPANPYLMENGKYNLANLFTDALIGCKSMRAVTLRDKVMQLAQISQRRLYDELRVKALDDGIIKCRKPKSNLCFYWLANMPEPDEEPQLPLEQVPL